MTRPLAILLVMILLLGGGWQWPRLFWGGEQGLQVALYISWLLSIFVVAASLSTLVLRNSGYVVGLVAWFIVAIIETLDGTMLGFRAYEIMGQAFLLCLWLEATIRSEHLGPRVAAGIGAALHGTMFVIALPAKVMDPGFSAAVPDIMARNYPWWGRAGHLRAARCGAGRSQLGVGEV